MRRVGMSTKIKVALDGLEKSRKLILGSDQQFNYAAAGMLLNGLKADILIADKGY